MANLSRDDLNSVIFTITQSILSVMVVGGVGWFLSTQPGSEAATSVVGLGGVVLTFYFSQAINNNATNNAIKAQGANK